MEYIIIFISLIIFFNTFKREPIIDDIRHIKEINSGILKNIPWYENIRRRCYGIGTLANNNGDVNIYHENILTTLIHTTICIFIYKTLGNDNVSFAAAILYLVNPANNQTSLWNNGRRYSINILLVLIMLYLGPIGIILYPVMPFLQFNALFSPVLLSPYMALVIPIFFLIGQRHIIKWYKERLINIPKGEIRTFKPRRIIVIIKSFGFYFFKMLFPGTTLFTYKTLYFWGITKDGNKDAYAINKDFFKGILAIFIYLSGFLLFRENLFNMWLFMGLAILQWCNIITVTQTLADRYMSLPNVFMMFFLAYILNIFNMLIPLGLFIFGYYLCQLYVSMRMYNGLTGMYDYNIYLFPEGVSARSFRASALLKNKDFNAAWEDVRHGLHHNPNDFKFLFQGAICARHMGDKFLSDTLIKRAEENMYLGQETSHLSLIEKFKSNEGR